MRKDLHEANRLSWNAATQAHNSHKADQAAFLRNGGSTLFPEECELLGDINGQSLLHLQCNAGQDTLSLAGLGAHVTGVDISDEAIGFATQLAADAGIPARFERADVYDWLERAAEQPTRFDIVFASYGFILWLSDLPTWARGVAAALKPGGRFVMIEFHPFAMTFDRDWKRVYPYHSGGEALKVDEGLGDYVGLAGAALAPSGYLEGVKDFKNPHASYEFAWGISDVVTALLGAGLQLSVFREYPFMNGARLFEDMREFPGNRFVPPESLPDLPLMYGLTARKGG